jgi:hypothetical protein
MLFVQYLRKNNNFLQCINGQHHKIDVILYVNNRRSFHGDGHDFTGCQIQWKVVSVALMHDFHTKISTIDNVSPSVDYTSFRVNNCLVEV